MTDYSDFVVWSREGDGGYRTEVIVLPYLDRPGCAEVRAEVVGPRGGRSTLYSIYADDGDYSRLRRQIRRDREVLNKLEYELDKLALDRLRAEGGPLELDQVDG